jgi:arylformamidase
MIIGGGINMKKFIELTHPIHEGMITAPAPWHPVVEITQLGRHCLEGRESYKVVLGSHTGTHMDSPAHMVENGTPRLDKVPLDILIGPAKMIRLEKGSYEKITVKDIENSNIKIEKGDRIVIRTGWYHYWGTKKFFREYPCFTLEAADYLVSKGICYIGMDTPSPDNPLDKLEPGQPNPLHYAFLSNGVLINEYLNNLDAIPVDKFELITLPLLVKDIDGFPVRAVAVIEE